MTDANPAFDTVHPSGHILVRSCRGGYMHSVALSAEAMDTDVANLAQAIVLTADVSCLKALLEVRDEIIAAGHTPSAEVPDRPRSRLGHREVAGASTAPPQKGGFDRADSLKQPGLGGIGVGCDIDGRLDRIGAEQLSRAAQQRTHLVELLLQRRISHVPRYPGRDWRTIHGLTGPPGR